MSVLEKKYKVFIVEDSSVYRSLLVKNLSQLANADSGKKPLIEIKSFSTGEECLEYMDENPEIVIIDYYLSDGNSQAMDGLLLLKNIKKKYPETQVIVLSEQNDVLITAEMYNQGASEYISKEHEGRARIQNAVIKIINTLESKRQSNTNKNIASFVMGTIVGIFIGRFI
jgi:DNA-binding NtrC family response regulator